MILKTTTLPELYQEDETAWLERMAQLAAEQRLDELDCQNLSEFLHDMAKRDRREVYSRLVVLLAHLLKWNHLPEQRTSSWQTTIMTQRLELRLLLESGTLRNHAAAVLADAYQDARKRAAAESERPLADFPTELSFTVDELIAEDSEEASS